MIRMIATDMDGTLLTDKKEMHPDTFRLVKKMKKEGMLFAAASGRQCSSLLYMFDAVKEDVYFISDNGAYVYYQGEIVSSSAMDREVVQGLLDAAEEMENTEVIVCGMKHAYITDHRRLAVMRKKFHYDIEYIENLKHVQEDIIKVSFLDKQNVFQNSLKMLLPHFKDKAELTVSGFDCLDIVAKGVSKGNAILEIQKKCGISAEETAVFGDNENDISMFPTAYYSYAMENASEKVRKKARFLTGKNNDHAVILEMKRLLAGQLPEEEGSYEGSQPCPGM